MKLLLTSAGNTNSSIENAFLNLLGKPFEDATAVFIPTAANIEEGDKKWYVDQMDSFRKLNFKVFDVVDISAISKELWFPRIENKDAYIFSGGNVSHLLFWMKKSGMDALLPGFLKQGIYVGISAGSMATVESLALSNPAKKEIAKKLDEYMGEEGLGYVPFHIRTHLNSKDFPHAYEENIAKAAEVLSETIYAIDDNTAIQVIDGNVKVISEGEWKKFN